MRGEVLTRDYEGVLVLRSVLIVSVVLLSGCQGLWQGYEDLPEYRLPVGSTLVLLEDVSIPANSASIYLQGGRILPFGGVDLYHPHCKFELRTLRPAPQRVDADTFVIVKVRRESDYARDTRVQWLAGGGVMFMSDGPSPQMYATLIFLRSEAQPDVFRLTCGHWEDPVDAEHLTIGQICQALGDVFTLKLIDETVPHRLCSDRSREGEG